LTKFNDSLSSSLIFLSVFLQSFDFNDFLNIFNSKSTINRWRSEKSSDDFKRIASKTLRPSYLTQLDEESTFSRTTIEIQ
jgi:hypothetical protein